MINDDVDYPNFNSFSNKSVSEKWSFILDKLDLSYDDQIYLKGYLDGFLDVSNHENKFNQSDLFLYRLFKLLGYK